MTNPDPSRASTPDPLATGLGATPDPLAACVEAGLSAALLAAYNCPAGNRRCKCDEGLTCDFCLPRVIRAVVRATAQPILDAVVAAAAKRYGDDFDKQAVVRFTYDACGEKKRGIYLTVPEALAPLTAALARLLATPVGPATTEVGGE